MKYSITMSLMMHVILLMLGMFLFQYNHEQYYGIYSQQHIPTFLNSVLVQQPLEETVTKDAPIEAVPLVRELKEAVSNAKENKKKDVKVVTEHKKLVSKQKLKIQRLLATKQVMGEGETQSKLTVLLHHAIERYKTYPVSAIQLEREGQVTISFTLFPNGHIEHLKLEQTSGTHELDQAALKAVMRATPFAGVKQLLQAPKMFKFKIDFELTEND